MLFGSLKSGVEGRQKQHVWKEITVAVNSIGVDDRSDSLIKEAAL